MDYVITQVQLAQFKMKAGETKKSVMLNFQHPVKELYFVSQSEEAVRDNDPNYYNTIVNAELRFNNEVVFSRNGLFLAYEQASKTPCQRSISSQHRQVWNVLILPKT
jgi:hypothetical protein